jgi:ABC-type branched-subunit amino acid transport system substrate-binding protein
MNWKLVVGRMIFGLGMVSASLAMAETGVSDSTILVGQSAPLSGPSQELGNDMKLGIQLYFDYVNSQGGINGRKLELKTLDDGYEPERTAANTRQLTGKDGAFSLLGYVGTPTSVAALQVSNPAKVPFVGAFTGSDALRAPFSRYVFNVRASYAEECERIVEQFTSLSVKRIAVFFQDDGFGKAVLSGVERAMEKRGLKIVNSTAIERNSMNVAPAAKAMAAVQPDMVIMAVPYKPSAAFVNAIRAEGAAPQFYTVSFVGPQALARELGPNGAGVGVSQVMPFPWSINAPIVREYQKLLSKVDAKAEPSYVSLEGFIAAKVFVEGVKRAGKDLTREKFIGAMEGIRNYDAGGYSVNFTPNDHNGSKFVELTVLRRDGKYIR